MPLIELLAGTDGQVDTSFQQLRARHVPRVRRRVAMIRALLGDLVTYAGARAWLLAVLMVLAALLEGGGLLLLVPILGVLIQGPLDNLVGQALLWLGLTEPIEQLVGLLFFFVVAAVLRAQVMCWRDLEQSRLQLGFARAQRNDMMARLTAAGWNRLAQMDHARLISIVNNDVPRAVMCAQALLRIAVAALLVAVNAAIAFSLAPQLVLLLLVLLCLGGLFLWSTQKQAFGFGERVSYSAKELIGNTQNMLHGLKTALAQEQSDWFNSEFQRVQEEIFNSQFAFQRSQAGARRLFGIFSALLAAALVLGGFWFDLSPASLLVVVLVMARLAGPILQLQQTTQSLLFALPSVEVMHAARAELGDLVTSRPAALQLSDDVLVLDDVSYRHADGGGLGPLSLTIAPGEIVGIEGPSGAGKSTLVDLVAGLIEPQSGQIRLGDTMLSLETLPSWRRRLSYLGQQTFLFNDSLRANLALGVLSVSDDEVWWALETTGIADLVKGLQNGLDAHLGESGTTFSGGERQRIALARALLRRPRFLILDEATSAIDIASEAELLERLAALPERPSIVTVAHRRESLSQCGRVITLVAGELVAIRGGDDPGHY